MWFVIINNNNGMTADRLTSMSSLYVYPAWNSVNIGSGFISLLQ